MQSLKDLTFMTSEKIPQFSFSPKQENMSIISFEHVQKK